MGLSSEVIHMKLGTINCVVDRHISWICHFPIGTKVTKIEHCSKKFLSKDDILIEWFNTIINQAAVLHSIVDIIHCKRLSHHGSVQIIQDLCNHSSNHILE
jgi:hypothetical protein